MSKPVILTGLRASNELHIGNYFGAVLPLVDMAKQKANDYHIHLMVADLHTLTTPADHTGIQKQIVNNLRFYIASGLPIEHASVNLFRQSYVPAHSELTWILDCFTGMGEMERMTQYKDKSRKLYKENSDYYNKELADEHDYDAMKQVQKKVIEEIKSRVSVGLFNYPVLMAADILLYGATYVPVGDDQSQHLEYTRDVVGRLNTRFGELFVMPESVKKQHEFFGKDQGLRIKDLQDPSKKMSKSDESAKGVIFLGDAPGEAHKKIMSAATDSLAKVAYDPEGQPGIANLLQIYGLLTSQSAEQSANEFAGQTQYGEFKKVVADKVVEFLENFQTNLAQVDQAKLGAKLVESEKAMNQVAKATLLRVQKAVGLR